MIKTMSAVVSAAALVALVVLGYLVLAEEREQTEKLARLSQCVRVLAQNQGVAPGQPIMACPIE